MHIIWNQGKSSMINFYSIIITLISLQSTLVIVDTLGPGDHHLVSE